MRITFFASIILLVFCCMAYSQQQQQPGSGRLGAGVIFGEPTGIAWKYQINQTNAVDGSIGFSPNDRYRVNIDYLWQAHPFSERNLGLHYGAGAAFGFGRTDYVVYSGGYFYREREVGFGVRGVVGLNYMIPRSPVDLFMEVAPVVVLTPASNSGIDAGFGARFYF